MNNDFNIDFNRIPLFKIVEKHYLILSYIFKLFLNLYKALNILYELIDAISFLS